MGNVVRTEFIGEARQLFKTIEDIKAGYKSLSAPAINPALGVANPQLGESVKALKESASLQIKLEQLERSTQATKQQTLKTERELVKVEEARLALQQRTDKIQKSQNKLISPPIPVRFDSQSAFKNITSDIGKSLNIDLKASDKLAKQLESERLKEVAAINSQTQRNAKQQSDFRIAVARRTADAEIAEERRVDRYRQQSSKDLTARLQTPSSDRGSFGSSLGLAASVSAGFAVGAGLSFLKDSTQAAFDAERANRKLSASATEAGLAYSILAEKNRDFAKSAGLSETAATNVTAKIAQLATFSGRPGDIDKLQKSFLDLSAAKGINSNDIDTLIGTILSGQDEGLNRLGIADPGQLYKAYAKEIGKTADSLSQFEKVQAATNAVMEKAAIFTGANTDKMNSLSGQSEAAAASIENFYTNFGQGVTQSVEFRDFLSFANDALNTLTTNLQNVRRELAKGTKTPKQIAEEDANKPGSVILDAYKNASAVSLATVAYPFDALGSGFKTANERYLESIKGAKKRRVDTLTDLFTAEKNILDRQSKDAQEQNSSLAQKTFSASFLSKIDLLLKPASDGVAKIKIQAKDIDDARRELNNNLAKLNETDFDKAQEGLKILERKFTSQRFQDLEKRFARNPNFKDAQANLASLTGFQDVLPEEQFESFSDKLNDFIKNDLEKANEKIKEIGKNANSVFESLYEKANKDNPFANIFSEADKAAKELEKSLRGLSPELQSIANTLQQKLDKDSLFNTRLENDFAAFDLRESAADFRKPQKGIEDTNKFFNDYIEAVSKKLDADFVKNGSGATRYNSNIFTDKNGKEFTNGFSQSNERRGVRYNSNIFTDGVNPDGSPRQFTNGFSQSEENPLIRYNSNIFTDKNGKQFTNGFSQSNLSFADLTEKEKNEFMNKDNLSLQGKLSRSIDLAGNRNALNDEQKRSVDRKIISLTQGIDPSKLTDNQRDAAASAREREAERLDQNEAKAREQRQQQIDLQARIASELTGLREIAKEKGSLGLEQTIRFINDSDTELDFLPKRPQ